MSTDIIVRDDGLAPEVIGSAFDLAEKVARTEFVPGALRGKPEAVMACILMGREIGVGPMQSLSKIHVVDGRPAMAAELMRARVLEAGHDIWIEEKSSTRITVAGKRRGSEHVSKVTWTMDDAKRAGIAGKNNWRKYPRQMLTARASAELCRDVFADCLGGVSYSVEELEDGGFGDAPESPEVEVEVEAAAAGKRTAKKGTVRRQAPKKQAAAARPSQGPPLPHEVAAEEQPSPEDDGEVVDAEVVDEEDDDQAEPEAEDLSRLTKAQLVLRCHAAGLDTEGTKDELIGRLSGGGADFREPSSGAVEGPDGGETDEERFARGAREHLDDVTGEAAEPDSQHEPRPFDRDGAQRAFHARLHDLGLDYEAEVRPWMLESIGVSLSDLADDRLRSLLDGMERQGPQFVTVIRYHAAGDADEEPTSEEVPDAVTEPVETSEAGDGEAPAAEDPHPAGETLADRARKRAAAASTHGQLQRRCRAAWAVLAVHDHPTYAESWATVGAWLDGDASVEDWSSAPEIELRRHVEDLERQAARFADEREAADA